jgi:hypothetical protein
VGAALGRMKFEASVFVSKARVALLRLREKEAKRCVYPWLVG